MEHFHSFLPDFRKSRCSRIKAIFVTDSVTPKESDWQQLKIVSIAPLIATAIQRFKSDGSISDLF
ncbi:hypothetical protein I8748_28075 [Nostoc sp. CENA67]|uniref:Uncharacterized protein n=1 Tax=Amazonocrinis nigriterrae CENA67 TaxID=2794033 RepID=A0A8J7HUG7_9NOST|nr:hypothetical protein [Amazonocrinis nigriterrae]MBH8565977.1 hypothetical protein [Amazonocrinis nigriterrae CENA67]